MKMKKCFLFLIIFCTYLNSQDFSEPNLIEKSNAVFHFDPVNQDTTSICWSFSTLSFIETELYRLKGKKIKLAVNYPVYYGFIEKAKYFIKTKGRSRFNAGDLFPTVINVIKKYGILPETAYSGKISGKKTYNQKAMYDELYQYIEKIKADSNWNENIVIPGVNEILNKHIGSPPKKFMYSNKEFTPLEFAEHEVNLNWNDYVKITSFESAPFYSFIKLNVPDNWKSDSTYYNVPLDTFFLILKNGIKGNYSMAIDGDIGEPGRLGEKDICIIPEYDIPSDYISQRAREYRFEKGLTTDDHLMHLIGYQNIDNKDWFLVKDSWRDAFTGKHKGYFFFSDDYIKLKVLAFLIHKDVLNKIIPDINIKN